MARQGNGADPVRLVAHIAAVLSIGAGVIHVSAAGDHTSLPVMFAGFLVVAALQVGLGALLILRRPPPLLVAGGIALMASSVGIWLLSRTAGLPFLEDGHTEAVGFKDGITVLFEVASIPVLLLLLSSELDRVQLPSRRFASRAFSFVGATCCALLVPAMLLGGGEHHTHDEAVALGIHGHDEDEPAHVESERAHSDAPGDHHAGSEHPRRKANHGHGDAAPAADQHEHQGVALASLPSSGHAHGGGDTTPVSHTERDHADRDAGEHHGGRRDGPEAHAEHPRRRDDDTGHDDDHGGDHGGGDQAEEPEQPLDELVSDVVAVVPLPAAEARRRCARRESRVRRSRASKRCSRR